MTGFRPGGPPVLSPRHTLAHQHFATMKDLSTSKLIKSVTERGGDPFSSTHPFPLLMEPPAIKRDPSYDVFLNIPPLPQTLPPFVLPPLRPT